MLTKKDILDRAVRLEGIKTADIAREFGMSRQYASTRIAELVSQGGLVKIGSTRSAFYVLPRYAHSHPEIFPTHIARSYRNTDLEEHIVLNSIESSFPALRTLPENVRSIFTYAFSEMFNNAIEHSKSPHINVEVALKAGSLIFTIDDVGIGVFRNIMRKRKLHSELEAIQDLLKGKTTTMPRSHSGEGIFFTSKVGDVFILDSFERRLIVNGDVRDIFLQKPRRSKKGTRVTFKIRVDSRRHLNDVFREYASIGEGGDYGFDKTEVKVKLYLVSGVHVSRSQARRVLAGLEKFKLIVFDFDRVPTVGQAFADEIFRVFSSKHPEIRFTNVNMNDGVQFMIDRVEKNNPKAPRLFGVVDTGS